MTTAKKSKTNLVSKGISTSLNLCGRTLLVTFDTCMNAVSLVGSTAKKTVTAVTGAPCKTTFAHRQNSATEKQIMEYKAELETLCTNLGSEIYHAGKSDVAAANVKVIQEDIETLQRIIAFLEKKKPTQGRPEAKDNSSVPPINTPPVEPCKTAKTSPRSTSPENEAVKLNPPEKTDTQPEANEPPPATVEKNALPSPAQNKKYTRPRLKKMLKKDLLVLAHEQSLNCQNSMTKDAIIALIIKSFE